MTRTELTDIYKQDHLRYCEDLLWVIDDNSNLLRLKPNNIQVRINNIADTLKLPPELRPPDWKSKLLAYNKEENLDKQHKILMCNVLKARREGSSTIISSRGFKIWHLYPYSKGIIVAHIITAVDTIFRMMKIYYEKLPPEWQIAIKRNNKKELLSDITHALFQVQTASEVNASRSAGYRFQLRSEIAFWERADETTVALNQAFSNDEGAEVWNETTPNGQGGRGAYFYDFWQDTKNGNTEYVNMFLTWFDFAKYTLPFVNNLEKERLMESIANHKSEKQYGNEEQLIKNYNLTYQQINWRRWYIRNKCNNDLNKFIQEYPEDDETCFLSTGGSFFNVDLCIAHELNAMKETPEMGNLYWNNVDDKEKGVYFREEPNGYLTIYKRPDDLNLLNRYGMGWDVSEGVEEGDYTVGQMLDLIDPLLKQHIVQWRGLLSSDYIKDELLKLSYWYGARVWHCIEKQGEGLAVINMVKDEYDYLYTRTKYNKIAKTETEEIGFDTNPHNKAVILPYLRKMIEDDILRSPDKDFWSECKTMVKGDAYVKRGLEGTRVAAIGKNKSKGKRKRYDDRVIAMALAVEMSKQMLPIIKDDSSEPKWWRDHISKVNRPNSYMGA